MVKQSDSPEWSSQSYWQGRFAVGDTPWDLDAPSSVLMEGLDELKGIGLQLAGRKVLSPGCGRGSDALEFVRRGADVVAVDWSEAAVSALRARYAASTTSYPGSLDVIQGDLFEVPVQHVDVVCEHTFFCAIDPSMRPRYAETVGAWVNPGGFLVGNFFVVSDTEARRLPHLSLTKEGKGPPFATTTVELEALLSPYFVTRVLRPGSRAEPSRKEGIEWVGLFERRS
jgi:SAM-dependent methyltransferase